MTAFRLSGVSFSYGKGPVLKNVSLEAAAGEMVALLGPNGAGKTTLTRLLVALLHPDAGTVSIGSETTDGKSPEDLADRVGYVFQHPDQQLFARTVLEEVAFGPRQRGVGATEAHDLAMDALVHLGMHTARESHPYDIPLAQRKLVTIAAAVAQRPRVLVLDEPAQGLDRETTDRVSALIREMAGEGVAVLAVSHDLAFVAETFDRVLVLTNGEVVADDCARNLIMNPVRATDLGLRQPDAARISSALDLPGAPFRMHDVSQALAGRLHPGGLQ